MKVTNQDKIKQKRTGGFSLVTDLITGCAGGDKM